MDYSKNEGLQDECFPVIKCASLESEIEEWSEST